MKKTNKGFIPFDYRYPLIDLDKIPKKRRIVPISYKRSEIDRYHVIYYHRMMNINYGRPSEIDWDEIKISVDETIKVGVEWRYYITTKSGYIILVGTKDRNTLLEISFVLPEKDGKPSETLKKEAKNFINDFLNEIERIKGFILISERSELEKDREEYSYFLDNVFLINYNNADLMLEYADHYENELLYEAMKYDARDKEVSDNPEKMAHIDKFMMAKGMFYTSSISYYIQALEGFINLIYHALLNDELREKGINLEERLPIDLKLKLVFRLCRGFSKNNLDYDPEIMKKFYKLREYRNQLFHSKIINLLQTALIVENGFLYPYDFSQYKNSFIPPKKRDLSKNNVLEIRKIVDEIIQQILNKMDKQSIEMVTKYLMKEYFVPFCKNKNGEIRLSFTMFKKDIK